MFRALEFVFPPAPAQVRNRKLSAMVTKFRKDHKMHGLLAHIFHVICSSFTPVNNINNVEGFLPRQ